MGYFFNLVLSYSYPISLSYSTLLSTPKGVLIVSKVTTKLSDLVRLR
jgi:hypothetical protein